MEAGSQTCLSALAPWRRTNCDSSSIWKLSLIREMVLNLCDFKFLKISLVRVLTTAEGHCQKWGSVSCVPKYGIIFILCTDIQQHEWFIYSACKDTNKWVEYKRKIHFYLYSRTKVSSTKSKYEGRRNPTSTSIKNADQIDWPAFIFWQLL